MVPAGPGARAGVRSCFRALHTSRPSTQTRHQKHSSGPFMCLLPCSHPAGADGPRTTGNAPEALQVARAPAVSGTVARGGDPTGSSPNPRGRRRPAECSEPLGEVPGDDLPNSIRRKSFFFFLEYLRLLKEIFPLDQ